MGTSFTSPASFVAATKAKAAEVNAKFSDIYTGLATGTHDPYTNAYLNNRISNGSVNISANRTYFAGYFTIDTNATYLLQASSSRMVVFGALTVNSLGSIALTSGAELLVV